MSKHILILPGDGIGPEIVTEAVKVLATLRDDFGLDIDMDEALVGGAASDATGGPLPGVTLEMAKEADAGLLGAVGLDDPFAPGCLEGVVGTVAAELGL